MSVEGEILRIQHNIAEAYAAVASMGGTVPTQPTSANLASAVASIPTGGSGIPTGCILIWSGASNAVPDGWALCDGTNGTPDLRGRFVLGYSSSHKVGSTGGAETVTLTTAQMPKHTHTFVYSTRFFGESGYAGVNGIAASSYSNTVTTSSTGSGSAHENMPPYYALCYIMKL